MKLDTLVKIAMSAMGVLFAGMAAMCFFVAAIGTFSTGRGAVIVMGSGLLLISLACFAFLHSRTWAKLLGLVVLLGFAGVMLWMVFRPDNPIQNPMIYRVAAIALGVLLLVRIGLTLRGKRGETTKGHA